MKHLIDSIVSRDFVEADSIISETVELIMARKLEEAKKMCAVKMSEQGLNKPSWNLQQRGLVEDDVEEAVDPKEGSDAVEKGTPKQVSGSVQYKDTPGSTHYKNNLKESDLPITKKKGKIWIHTHKTSGKEKHMSTSIPTSDEWEVKELKEETLEEARVRIIKARIRGGKIQRRKKISNVKGYKLQSGKLQRMTPAERRRRKMGARKAKIKRRTKMTRTLMKRQRSLRKRKALGL